MIFSKCGVEIVSLSQALIFGLTRYFSNAETGKKGEVVMFSVSFRVRSMVWVYNHT